MLAQLHRPGEAAQTDFTWTTELDVTVAGKPFKHMLCVFALPYSNWRWASVCHSESIASIRHGVQRALFQLGRVPEWHQTDNSTAATHRIPESKKVVHEAASARVFNDDYLGIMRHFGMKPRTTEVAAKEQNGDVEAANGALKRALNQALLRRGSRDFDSRCAWQTFVDNHLQKVNRGRGQRVSDEMATMRELNVGRLPEFVEESFRVSDWSTIRVKQCAYSVPSRLMGEWVQVRIFEDRIIIRYGDKDELVCERLRGSHRKRIDYRHIIWSLVRKPGGFARYVYREEMFPSIVFRRAYDAIQTPHRGTKGDIEYLRILHLAASTLEADVEAALTLLLGDNRPITVEAVKSLASAATSIEVPQIARSPVDLTAYDALLAEVGT